MGGMATCDRWPHGKGARDLRCAPPSLISFPFPYSISFFPLHLSSLPTFFSSSSPSFCCFSRTSGAQPPLPCPFRVPQSPHHTHVHFSAAASALSPLAHSFLALFLQLLTASPLRLRLIGLSRAQPPPFTCTLQPPPLPPSVCRFLVPSASQLAMPQ